LVDEKKGTIDLEASFHAGLFGSSNPANGVVKTLTFYYRLQDASNRALNKITVRVYHYKKLVNVPQALLDTLNQRANISNNVNMRQGGSLVSSSNGSNYGANHPVGNEPLNFADRTSLSELGTKPKRPPIIVVLSEL
jgi:hypothetical protein